MLRVHVMGASGSGTTTLGRVLGERLALRHLDTDDFFWMPTDPPFTTLRPVSERLELVQAEMSKSPQGWVLTGSALKWGTPLEPLYDLIVFLTIDPALRMARIRRRETERYGARILPGGDMAETSAKFLDWAASYDTAGPDQRSLVAHEAWLLTQAAPVLRLDSARPVDELVDAVLAHPVVEGSRLGG
ncbi:AAA family ATPase [Rhizobium sp. SGZ-381]|uniref:ATP-binding protein n=1 Tax=Rhizobium sp. SGZ-381 TaxID=3342800 RepID=UPI00366F7C00